jgi:hypothetical protein
MSFNINPIIIENLISEDLQKELIEVLKYNSYWYLSPLTSAPDIAQDPDDICIKDGPQMIHELVNHNEASSHLGEVAFIMCENLEHRLNCKIHNVIRIKSNMLYQNEGAEDFYHPPHIDSVNANHISVVYYVEDSDGETLVFDKTADVGHLDLNIKHSFKPVQGTAVAFPSKVFHASKSPVLHDTRVIINFLLEIDESKVVDLFYH